MRFAEIELHKPGQERLRQSAEAIAAFTARGGKLVVLGRPADGQLAWSPVPITAKTVNGVRSLVKHNPAMPAWISNADLYFRTERPASTFSAEGASSLDDRGTIASIPAGKGRIYLLGYEPADFTPVPIELGKGYDRTTKVPTYFDTTKADGLLQGTSYTSFIDQLVALKPIRLVHAVLDSLGVFNSQPLFTSTTRQNGKVGNEPFSVEVTNWKFRIDPENIGLQNGWQHGEGQGWADIKLSMPWESVSVKIHNGDIICIISKDVGHYVSTSHVGLAIQDSNGKIHFMHASAPHNYGKVVVDDTIDTYLRRYTRDVGIMVVRPLR